MIISYVGSAAPPPFAAVGWIAAYSTLPPAAIVYPAPKVRLFYAAQDRNFVASQNRDYYLVQERQFTADPEDDMLQFYGTMAPGAKLPWHINIKKMVEGRSVVSVSWELDAGLTLIEQHQSGDWITGHISAAGAVLGNTYKAKASVVTDGSPPIEFPATIVLKIEEM